LSRERSLRRDWKCFCVELNRGVWIDRIEMEMMERWGR
jgi:hypothetical protein